MIKDQEITLNKYIESLLRQSLSLITGKYDVMFDMIERIYRKCALLTFKGQFSFNFPTHENALERASLLSSSGDGRYMNLCD